MAVTRLKTSGISGSKYISADGGYPPLMAAPTASDGGTGTTASVAFTTNTAATSYTVLSSPGSFTGTGSSSPITVSGLTSGTAYTFQIRGVNAQGDGAYSAASNSITPIQPTAFESIASASGTGSSGVITFNSIPSTFKHLQIRYSARCNSAGTGFALQVQFNGDTGSNYYWHDYSATDAGITTSSSAATNIGQIPSAITGASTTADVYGVGIIDIPNYASSRMKVARAFFSSDQNASSGTNQRSGMESFLWNSTSAISSISLTAYSGSYTTPTEFSLYGIKGKA